MHLLVIYFGLVHNAPQPFICPSVYPPTCTTLRRPHPCMQTMPNGWFGWIAQASEGPTLGSWVTHTHWVCHPECKLCLCPTPTQPNTSRINTYQPSETNTRCHPNHALCVKPNMIPLYWKLGHFVLQLHHKTAWDMSSLKTSSCKRNTICS